MDWTQVQTVMRLWSLRPWLYEWDIYPLHEADELVDRRWCRWFDERGLTKKATCHSELSDEEFAMADRIHKIYKLVFDDEKEFLNREKYMNDIKMLVYNQSSLPFDPITPLVARARETPAIKIWMDKLPQKDDTDIVLLLFVCYNYCILLKVVDRAAGGLSTVINSMLMESSDVREKKDKGNKAYREEKYSTALEWYTAAIKVQSYNKKLYSNRAQCQIHKLSHRAAVSDGLRCISIDPLWEKGWRRYAQSLYSMGKVIPAWKVNEEGRSNLPPVQLKDLEEQAQHFKLHDEVVQYLKFRPQDSKKAASSVPKVNGHAPATSTQTTGAKTTREIQTDPLTVDLPGLVSDCDNTPVPAAKKAADKATITNSISTTKKSDPKTTKNQDPKKNSQKSEKVPAVIPTKAPKPAKGKEAAPNVNINNNNMRSPSQSELAMSLSPEVKKVRELLAQATSALLEKRMRNAVTLFTQALTMLDPTLQKAIDYHSDQVAIVLYALGQANISIGSEKDLDEGLNHFNNIFRRFPGLVFPLAYLGIGLTYFKWNRFRNAIGPLSKGLRIAKNRSLDTVYAWPESGVSIEESKKDVLIERLEDLLAQSHWPPAPLATCRYKECGHYQVQIYTSDPDFHGYIEMTCLAQCRIAFHQDCWKKTRTASNKEILNGKCFTPDCQSTLKNIITYDLTGEPSDEKANQITKEPAPRKPSKKMPASSQHTLLRRAQKKEVRKQKREEERQRQAEAANVDDLVNELEKAAEKADVKPAPDLRGCTVIIHKKDDDDDDNKKPKKKKRVHKERAVVRLDLVPPEQPYLPAHPQPDSSPSPLLGSYGRLDDFEELSTFPTLEASNPFPFAIPPHIAAQVSYLDDTASQSRKSSVSVPSRSQSPAVNETSEREKEIDDQNNRTAIRESIFQLFKGILQESGPLQIDDARITSHLAEFPPETLGIIESEGGIGSFLKKSVLFTVVDDVVGLLKHRNKILKEIAKSKAQARKSTANASERRNKKVVLDAIPPHLKPAAVAAAPSGSGAAQGAELSASRSAGAIDIESDHESIASSDTGTSESLEMTSNSSRNSSGKKKLSSSSSSLPVKSSSSWQRHPSSSPDDLTYNPCDVEPRSADLRLQAASPSTVSKPECVEVVNQYRLGANRLKAAVELGRLAARVNMRLGVEVRFLYGWKLTAGLEKVDVGTSQHAATLLKDGIQMVTSSSAMVYNTNGAEVYFFGMGQNSVEGERGQWVPGPEVAYNEGIIIALALDHVDMSTVNLQTMEHSADTLLAVRDAAETIRGIKDRFKANMEIKNALQPIFSTIGRRIASDDPETLSLLTKCVQLSKPPPGLSLNTSLPLPVTTPLVNSPHHPRAAASPVPHPANPGHNSTNQPTTSNSMSPYGVDVVHSMSSTFGASTTNTSMPPPGMTNASSSSAPPSLNPSSTSLSFGGIPSAPTPGTSVYAAALNTFSTAATSATSGASLFTTMSASTPSQLGAIWGNDLSAGAQAGFPSSLYGFNDPLTAAAKEREQQEKALQVAKKQANDYSQMIETLQLTLAKMNEELTNVTSECTTHKTQVSMQTDHLKVQEARIAQMTEREELMKDQIHQLTEENVQIRKQVEQIKANAEDNMAAAKREIAEHRDRAVREKTLRAATEAQYEDVLLERQVQYALLEEQHGEEKLRAQKAEVAMLQLKMDVGLSIIDRSTKEAEHYIATIRAQANQFSDQFLTVPAEYSTAEGAWKMTLTRLKTTRDDAIVAFEDQKTRVINGECLNSLPNLAIPCPPPAPEMPQLRPPPPPMMPQPHRVMGNGDSAASHAPADPLPNGNVTPPTVGASAAPTLSGFSAKAQQPPTAAAAVAKMTPAANKLASRPPGFSSMAAAAAAAAPKPVSKSKNSFDRIVDHIQVKHPELDRSRISSILQKVRQSRNGSLSGMKMEDVLGSAEFFITQENEKAKWAYSASGGAAGGAASMGGLDPVCLNTGLEQDPCTICLDELLPSNTQELDCRHRFHAVCIRQWLREKSTCPNCNKHALLADEFPKLC